MTNGSLMKVKVLQNAPLGAFCNTFDLAALRDEIVLKTSLWSFLRVAVLTQVLIG